MTGSPTTLSRLLVYYLVAGFSIPALATITMLYAGPKATFAVTLLSMYVALCLFFVTELRTKNQAGEQT